MSKIKLILAVAVLLAAVGRAHAQVGSFQNNCEVGGATIATQGLQSTNKAQGSWPGCLVTVYLTGTTNLATIYTNSALSPLANPFTANTLSGNFLFWASTTSGYDVTIGPNPAIPPTSTMPTFTFVDQFPNAPPQVAPVLYLTTFGALCNVTNGAGTDDSAAFNAAIAQAIAIAGSGPPSTAATSPVIVLPSNGNACGLANPVRFPGHISFACSAASGCAIGLLPALGSNNGLTVTPSTLSLSNYSAGIHNIQIFGAGLATTGTALEIQQPGYTVDGVPVSEHAGRGIVVNNAERVHINNSPIQGTRLSFVDFDSNEVVLQEVNSVFGGSVAAVGSSPACDFSINSTGTPACTYPTTGSVIPDNLHASMYFDGGQRVSVTGGGSWKGGAYDMPKVKVWAGTVHLFVNYHEYSNQSPLDIVGGGLIYSTATAAMSSTAYEVPVDTGVAFPAPFDWQPAYYGLCSDITQPTTIFSVFIPPDFLNGSSAASSIGGSITRGTYEIVETGGFCRDTNRNPQFLSGISGNIGRGQMGTSAQNWPAGFLIAQSPQGAELSTYDSHMHGGKVNTGLTATCDNTGLNTCSTVEVGYIPDGLFIQQGVAYPPALLNIRTADMVYDGTSGNIAIPYQGLIAVHSNARINISGKTQTIPPGFMSSYGTTYVGINGDTFTGSAVEIPTYANGAQPVWSITDPENGRTCGSTTSGCADEEVNVGINGGTYFGKEISNGNSMSWLSQPYRAPIPTLGTTTGVIPSGSLVSVKENYDYLQAGSTSVNSGVQDPNVVISNGGSGNTTNQVTISSTYCSNYSGYAGQGTPANPAPTGVVTHVNTTHPGLCNPSTVTPGVTQIPLIFSGASGGLAGYIVAQRAYGYLSDPAVITLGSTEGITATSPPADNASGNQSGCYDVWAGPEGYEQLVASCTALGTPTSIASLSPIQNGYAPIDAQSFYNPLFGETFQDASTPAGLNFNWVLNGPNFATSGFTPILSVTETGTAGSLVAKLNVPSTTSLVLGGISGCLSADGTTHAVSGTGAACGSGGGGATFPGANTIPFATSTTASTAATSAQIASVLNTSPSTTLAPALLPLATTGAFGVVKPDGTTVTISGGVISATGSGAVLPSSGIVYATSTTTGTSATSPQIVTALNTSPTTKIAAGVVSTLNQNTTGIAAASQALGGTAGGNESFTLTASSAASSAASTPAAPIQFTLQATVGGVVVPFSGPGPSALLYDLTTGELMKQCSFDPLTSTVTICTSNSGRGLLVGQGGAASAAISVGDSFAVVATGPYATNFQNVATQQQDWRYFPEMLPWYIGLSEITRHLGQTGGSWIDTILCMCDSIPYSTGSSSVNNGFLYQAASDLQGQYKQNSVAASTQTVANGGFAWIWASNGGASPVNIATLSGSWTTPSGTGAAAPFGPYDATNGTYMGRVGTASGTATFSYIGTTPTVVIYNSSYSAAPTFAIDGTAANPTIQNPANCETSLTVGWCDLTFGPSSSQTNGASPHSMVVTAPSSGQVNLLALGATYGNLLGVSLFNTAVGSQTSWLWGTNPALQAGFIPLLPGTISQTYAATTTSTGTSNTSGQNVLHITSGTNVAPGQGIYDVTNPSYLPTAYVPDSYSTGTATVSMVTTQHGSSAANIATTIPAGDTISFGGQAINQNKVVMLEMNQNDVGKGYTTAAQYVTNMTNILTYLTSNQIPVFLFSPEYGYQPFGSLIGRDWTDEEMRILSVIYHVPYLNLHAVLGDFTLANQLNCMSQDGLQLHMSNVCHAMVGQFLAKKLEGPAALPPVATFQGNFAANAEAMTQLTAFDANNTAIGYLACNALTGASNTTCVGNRAGQKTTIPNSVFLGPSSGVSSTSGDTGTDNTMIGYQADAIPNSQYDIVLGSGTKAYANSSAFAFGQRFLNVQNNFVGGVAGPTFNLTPALAPTVATVVCSNTGGSLAAGTYYWSIESVTSNGGNGGNSLPSTPVSCTITGSAGKATVEWQAVDGATTYSLFRGTSATTSAMGLVYSGISATAGSSTLSGTVYTTAKGDGGTVTPGVAPDTVNSTVGMTLAGAAGAAAPINFGSTTAVTFNGTVTCNGTCTGFGSGTAFSALTGGTNTTATMNVGTGASLQPTGTGTITANYGPTANTTVLGTGTGGVLQSNTALVDVLASNVIKTGNLNMTGNFTGNGTNIIGTYLTSVTGTWTNSGSSIAVSSATGLSIGAAVVDATTPGNLPTAYIGSAYVLGSTTVPLVTTQGGATAITLTTAATGDSLQITSAGGTTINGYSGGQTALNVMDHYALGNGTIAKFYNTALATANHESFYLGTAGSTNNAGEIRFTNAGGAGSSTNTICFGMYGCLGLKVDASGDGIFTGYASATQFIGTGSAPTIASGTGAGTGPTISISGTDSCGVISLTIGSSPTAGGTLATITFSATKTSAPQNIPLTPHNAATGAQMNMIYEGTPSTTTWTLGNGSTAIPATTVLSIGYGSC